MQALQREIRELDVRPLQEEMADAAFWNQQLGVYQGMGWLDLPWYLAETFFYRRLLDNARWPYTGRMEEIAAYFAASFLVMRTLKSEIMVGLEPGQAEELGAQDPDWLINGKRGIIQLVEK